MRFSTADWRATGSSVPLRAVSKLDDKRRAQLDALARRSDGDLPARLAGRDLDRRVDERDSIVSIFSDVNRMGQWEPPERLSVFTMFGGVELDFCDADLLEGTSELDVIAIFGGVEIRVPPGIHVETRGLGIFGSFSHLHQRADEPDAPVLRIKGLALFGGVEVKRIG